MREAEGSGATCVLLAGRAAPGGRICGGRPRAPRGGRRGGRAALARRRRAPGHRHATCACTACYIVLSGSVKQGTLIGICVVACWSMLSLQPCTSVVSDARLVHYMGQCKDSCFASCNQLLQLGVMLAPT